MLRLCKKKTVSCVRHETDNLLSRLSVELGCELSFLVGSGIFVHNTLCRSLVKDLVSFAERSRVLSLNAGVKFWFS